MVMKTFCLLAVAASASAFNLPSLLQNFNRRDALAAGILAPAAAGLLTPKPAFASKEARDALKAKAAVRQAAEAAAAAEQEKASNIPGQLDEIKALLQGSQDWWEVRRTFERKPLGNLRAFTKGVTEPDKVEKRKEALRLIAEVDQFAYEKQCQELAGYQIGPDKKMVDPAPLVKKIDDIKSAVSGLI